MKLYRELLVNVTTLVAVSRASDLHGSALYASEVSSNSP
jgi:hypothetical protein